MNASGYFKKLSKRMPTVGFLQNVYEYYGPNDSVLKIAIENKSEKVMHFLSEHEKLKNIFMKTASATDYFENKDIHDDMKIYLNTLYGFYVRYSELVKQDIANGVKF